ncbi:MAG: hypothetical protein ACOH2D_11640 [Gelidibacter sp.]
MQELSPYLIPLVTALIAWFGSRAKTKRELKSMELDNEIKTSSYYQGVLDDMSMRLAQAVKEIMALEDRYRQLMVMNSELLIEMKKLKDSNSDLIEEIRKFKQLNGKEK